MCKITQLFLLTLLIMSKAYGQLEMTNDDVLLAKFELQKKHNTDPLLFLHLDKTVQESGGRIWFSSYLIKVPAGQFQEHQVLSLSIIENQTNKLVHSKLFKMENGISSGSVELPDTLHSGIYHLLAYTDKLKADGSPAAIYRTPIYVMNSTFSTYGDDTPRSNNISSVEAEVSNAATGTAENGFDLKITKVVVQDTLRIELRGTETKNIKLLIHNYHDLFASINVKINKAGNRLAIALPAVPRGINTVTVLNDQGLPVAESVFFAHYQNTNITSGQLDKASYGQNANAKFKLSLKDSAQRPLKGVFSMAIVPDIPAVISDEQDIETYTYGTLAQMYPQLNRQILNSKEDLQSLLVSKSWTKHKWQDLTNINGIDANLKIPAAVIKGSVLYGGKILRKAVQLNIFGAGISTITTETDGTFVLDIASLAVKEGQEIKLSLNQTNKAGYSIKTESTFDMLNSKLAEKTLLYSVVKMMPAADRSIKSNNGRLLNEVSIKAPARTEMFYNKNLPGENACGDYVDEFGFLNYERSKLKGKIYQPIKGKQYMIRTDLTTDAYVFTVRSIIYDECLDAKAPDTFTIGGIHFEKDFYQDQLSDEVKKQEILFWKAGLNTNELGEAEVNFNTGSKKGNFNIIIQGLSENDVVYYIKKIRVE